MHEVIAPRLYSQRLAGRAASGPGEAVAWMGAMQAQEYASALWAVGLRCNASVATVEQAIVGASFVRTWLLRGTLHFVSTADVRWMLDLVGPRLIAASAGRHRQLGLDETTLARCVDAFAEALSGGGVLTRAGMLQVVEQAGITTEGQRGYHMLHHAGLAGVICFGPIQDKQQTFVLLDEWAPASAGPQGEDAMAELAVRYFQSHGPATLQDFVWWSGLRMGDARAGIDRARSRLRRETHDGGEHWSAGEAAPYQESSPFARLLPSFDEYYLGYRDRSAVLDPAFDSRVVSSNGIFRPILVIDGQVVGIWRQSRKGGSVSITLETLRDLAEDERQAVTIAVDRYGYFLGEPVRLT